MSAPETIEEAAEAWEKCTDNRAILDFFGNVHPYKLFFRYSARNQRRDPSIWREGQFLPSWFKKRYNCPAPTARKVHLYKVALFDQMRSFLNLPGIHDQAIYALDLLSQIAECFGENGGEPYFSPKQSEIAELRRKGAEATYSLLNRLQPLPTNEPTLSSRMAQAYVSSSRIIQMIHLSWNRYIYSQDMRLASQYVTSNRQAYLLKDIFGNPFTPAIYEVTCRLCNGHGRILTEVNKQPIEKISHLFGVCYSCDGNKLESLPGLHPSWKSLRVVELARTIYDNRDFALMPILGDALEEAGCTNSHVLSHCREEWPTTIVPRVYTCTTCQAEQSVPLTEAVTCYNCRSEFLEKKRINQLHVRGCWVLDLCLNL